MKRGLDIERLIAQTGDNDLDAERPFPYNPLTDADWLSGSAEYERDKEVIFCSTCLTQFARRFESCRNSPESMLSRTRGKEGREEEEEKSPMGFCTSFLSEELRNVT